MLPRQRTQDSGWPDPPSGIRKVNFDRELSVWFEEVFAPAEPAAGAPEDAAADHADDEWPQEERSGRIPFLIF